MNNTHSKLTQCVQWFNAWCNFNVCCRIRGLARLFVSFVYDHILTLTLEAGFFLAGNAITVFTITCYCIAKYVNCQKICFGFGHSSYKFSTLAKSPLAILLCDCLLDLFIVKTNVYVIVVQT